MKRIQRLTLSPKTVRFLAGRSGRVTAAPDPRAEARKLWNMQANRAFREIREALGKMASGLERCMYCEDSEGTAIEHFWPKSVYPDRAFDWLNYLIACSETGEALAVDPLDHEKCLAAAKAKGWNITQILNTHHQIGRAHV